MSTYNNVSIAGTKGANIEFRGTCMTKFVGLGDASASLNKESHIHCVI